MMRVRSSGILLHVTSLASPYGIGDLGPCARQFVDFLESAGQGFWQLLPLGPTSPAIGNSPYSSCSAFAGNPLLISPDDVADMGLAGRDELHAGQEHMNNPEHDPRKARYEDAETWKREFLQSVFERCKGDLDGDKEYRRFCDGAAWLDDYVLFITLKERFGGSAWCDWPEEFRDRRPEALAQWRYTAGKRIEYERFVQFLFFKQWNALKGYCLEKRVHVMGDAPIYVTFDSADVWAHPHLFKLGRDKRPTFVAGVPPDYFSETGQRWGNPVYDWQAHEEEDFAWWARRMGHNLRLFDYVRLDHFRGFSAYWEIPAEEETAVNGTWVKTPGEALFSSLCRRFSALPIIAEDLGVITPHVRELMNDFGFPGMKVLQFAFGGDTGQNRDAPHNYVRDCVAYAGTHDNNTTRGWFYEEAGDQERDTVLRYLGLDHCPDDMHWRLMRMVMQSPARTAIFTMQDILGMGAEARMNTPSVAAGNWGWRLRENDLDPGLAVRLRDMTVLYGRA